MHFLQITMDRIRGGFELFLEALFPLSEAERALLTIAVEKIWAILPRAPFSSIPESCALFAYKHRLVSSLVWSLKYKKSEQAARLGGYALFCTLRTYALAGVNIFVVPMPISKQRRRERGFNQCELLVDEIEKLNSAGGNTEIEQWRHIFITRKLLIRPRHIERQTLKDRRERLEEAHDLFAVDQDVLRKLMDYIQEIGVQENSEHYLVIIVDDVVTTGSTMKEAVNTLRQAGLVNTYGLAVAH